MGNKKTTVEEQYIDVLQKVTRRLAKKAAKKKGVA
jgi:hypothetical protein